MSSAEQNPLYMVIVIKVVNLLKIFLSLEIRLFLLVKLSN